MSIPKQTVAELFLRLVATKAQRIGFGSAVFNHVVKVHISRGSTFLLTLPMEPKINDGGEDV